MVAQNEHELPEPTGGGGALFARADNLRSDAKLAARMIALGVISLDQAEKLLRNGFALAMKSARKGDARGYSACMKIAIECAKLSQAERHKVMDKSVPDLHQHTAAVGVTITELLAEPEYVEFQRHRALSADCDAGAVCQIREPGNGKPVANGATHGGAGPGANGHRNGGE